MKKLLFSAFLLISMNIHAQDWGIGIRLGDPSGITLKKYMSSNALELSVGRTHLFNGRGWYDKGFNKWYNNKNFGYNDYDYVGYNSSVPLGIQIHYLFQKSITEVAEEEISGLDWYFGFGGQLRFQNYSYDYRYKLTNKSDWVYKTERVTDFDIGADGVIGLEYTFSGAPISVFLDMTLFMEIVDDPFRFWFQGGIGGRYNF